MAAGTVTFKVTNGSFNLNIGSNVQVDADVAKFIEDDLGGLNTVGTWHVTRSYALAGFGAMTITQIKTDIINDAKAQNAPLAGKTIN